MPPDSEITPLIARPPDTLTVRLSASVTGVETVSPIAPDSVRAAPLPPLLNVKPAPPLAPSVNAWVLLASPIVSVPTVRDVVSIVTVRAAVMLLVSPTTSPAAFPGTAAGSQLEPRLQLPAASTFQVPLWAKPNPGERAKSPAARVAPIPTPRTSDLVINIDRMRSSASKKVRPRLDVPRPQNQDGE